MTSMPVHLVRRVRQQGQLPRPHDRRLQLALVHRAHARDAPRQNLRALRHEGQQHLGVLVIDVIHLVRAELAHLAAAEHAAPRAALLAAPPVAARLRTRSAPSSSFFTHAYTSSRSYWSSSPPSSSPRRDRPPTGSPFAM